MTSSRPSRQLDFFAGARNGSRIDLWGLIIGATGTARPAGPESGPQEVRGPDRNHRMVCFCWIFVFGMKGVGVEMSSRHRDCESADYYFFYPAGLPGKCSRTFYENSWTNSRAYPRAKRTEILRDGSQNVRKMLGNIPHPQGKNNNLPSRNLCEVVSLLITRSADWAELSLKFVCVWE